MLLVCILNAEVGGNSGKQDVSDGRLSSSVHDDVKMLTKITSLWAINIYFSLIFIVLL